MNKVLRMASYPALILMAVDPKLVKLNRAMMRELELALTAHMEEVVGSMTATTNMYVPLVNASVFQLEKYISIHQSVRLNDKFNAAIHQTQMIKNLLFRYISYHTLSTDTLTERYAKFLENISELEKILQHREPSVLKKDHSFSFGLRLQLLRFYLSETTQVLLLALVFYVCILMGILQIVISQYLSGVNTVIGMLAVVITYVFTVRPNVNHLNALTHSNKRITSTDFCKLMGMSRKESELCHSLVVTATAIEACVPDEVEY